MTNWWETFFDYDYIRVFSGFFTQAQTAEHAEGLWQLLNLQEGSRVLDAPCGYGRLSRALAERGAIVLGVDQSEILLEKAEKDRGQLPATRLRYIRHDLRKPMEDRGFDAAFNVFSSIGYGTEQDDLAVLQTLRSAVRPGGLVLLEAAHRDMVAALRSRGTPPARRLSDGTLIAEESTFDSISGRVHSRWFWWGPGGRGEKSASLRLYTATELVGLMQTAGLRFRSAHRGYSLEPFKGEGMDMGGRLAILAERETTAEL